MSKTTIAAAVLATALWGGVASADDSSMSRWTGDSYQAFEAARINANATVHYADGRGPTPDNGMSRWNGDSYVMFEQVRTAPVSISVAEANRARIVASRDVPARATRGRAPVNAFRDDTGA
jgi:hypothetical protein